VWINGPQALRVFTAGTERTGISWGEVPIIYESLRQSSVDKIEREVKTTDPVIALDVEKIRQKELTSLHLVHRLIAWDEEEVDYFRERSGVECLLLPAQLSAGEFAEKLSAALG